MASNSSGDRCPLVAKAHANMERSWRMAMEAIRPLCFATELKSSLLLYPLETNEYLELEKES